MDTSKKRVPLTYCTTREAARRLGISLRTAQLWVENGQLEAWKTEGGHRRISVSSVERLLADPSASRAGRAQASAESEPAFRVLAVDDDTVLLKVLAAFFKTFSFPVSLRLARSGYEGLIALGEEKPDLLLTDLRMQGMDGFELVRQLARLPNMAGLAIIVMTALDDDEIAAGGGVPGARRILHKPISLDILRDQVTRLRAERLAEAAVPL